jgi:hypothetical protein
LTKKKEKKIGHYLQRNREIVGIIPHRDEKPGLWAERNMNLQHTLTNIASD